MTKKKDILLLYFLVAIEILILFNSKTIIKEVTNNIFLFITVIMPSILPTMIISSLLIKNNIYLIIPKIIFKIFNKLFNFNNIATTIFIMSFISGSPTNGLIINNYLNNKLISIKEAENLLCCTHFINPLFIIGMSNILFKSSLYGYITIILLLLSNLIKSYVLRNNFNNIDVNSILINSNFITTIKNTIKDTFEALFIVLGIIILFNILLCLLTHIFSFNNYIILILSGLLEITSSLSKLSIIDSNVIRFILFYVFISFGGFSIILQTISMIENKKIKFFKYFIFRMIYV